ncbi:hypothetical protein ACHWQZ_G006005 [Mnemiopsis leidyi]
MTSLAPPKVPIRHGGLIKRSVAKSMTTIKAKFQHRFFKLFEVVYVSRSDKMRILYIQGPCFSTTKSWIEEIRRLLETAVGADKYTHYHKGAFLKNCWSCCKNKDKYAKGCTGISESDEARTTRLSRNISNVSAFSPRFARDGSEMDGSWETLGRSASPATFLSDDEYTDDEL